MNPAIEQLAVLWAKAYQRRPVVTSVVTVLAGVALGSTIYITESRAGEIRERERRENLSYERQIAALDEMERNARQLINFVSTQQRELRQAEDILNRLRAERQNLQPVVEADRQVIAALFAQQEARNRTDIWWERGISFALGVASSLVAVFLVTAFRYVRRFRKPSLAAQVPPA